MTNRPEVLIRPQQNFVNFAMVRCPNCKGAGWVDQEQYEGKVSIQCDCGYHETHDLREASDE